MSDKPVANLVKNDRKTIRAWAMYDWANSAFSATVVTVLLGPYLAALINRQPDSVLVVWGYPIEAEAFYPFCVSISVILQVLFLPILGTLADHTNLKKRLMMGFAYGLGGMISPAVGKLADIYSLRQVFIWLAMIPLLTIVPILFFPHEKRTR